MASQVFTVSQVTAEQLDIPAGYVMDEAYMGGVSLKGQQLQPDYYTPGYAPYTGNLTYRQLIDMGQPPLNVVYGPYKGGRPVTIQYVTGPSSPPIPAGAAGVAEAPAPLAEAVAFAFHKRYNLYIPGVGVFYDIEYSLTQEELIWLLTLAQYLGVLQASSLVATS